MTQCTGDAFAYGSSGPAHQPDHRSALDPNAGSGTATPTTSRRPARSTSSPRRSPTRSPDVRQPGRHPAGLHDHAMALSRVEHPSAPRPHLVASGSYGPSAERAPRAAQQAQGAGPPRRLRAGRPAPAQPRQDDRARARRVPARRGLLRRARHAGPQPRRRGSTSGPTPTASSPASARSTAARCSSSARTSPCSAARSARCSPRRSTRSWTWRRQVGVPMIGLNDGAGARIQEGVVSPRHATAASSTATCSRRA